METRYRIPTADSIAHVLHLHEGQGYTHNHANCEIYVILTGG